jgi:tRNA/tmRNA/rRNA uracil-C5-methylase (TrmA/RlmC/RlmD family)
VVEASIENAKQNALRNQIDNVDWICADAKEAFEQLNSKINVLVVDPPRKGLSTEALENIIELKADRMIYISCEPSTLVRDLKALSEIYTIENVLCVDMFGQTTHVETIVKLTLKKASV